MISAFWITVRAPLRDDYLYVLRTIDSALNEHRARIGREIATFEKATRQ